MPQHSQCQGDPQRALTLAAAQGTRREHQGTAERERGRRPAFPAEMLLPHPHSDQHREHRLQVEQQRRGPRGEQRQALDQGDRTGDAAQQGDQPQQGEILPLDRSVAAGRGLGHGQGQQHQCRTGVEQTRHEHGKRPVAEAADQRSAGAEQRSSEQARQPAAALFSRLGVHQDHHNNRTRSIPKLWGSPLEPTSQKVLLRATWCATAEPPMIEQK